MGSIVSSQGTERELTTFAVCAWRQARSSY
jgi:hypothetical protein